MPLGPGSASPPSLPGGWTVLPEVSPSVFVTMPSTMAVLVAPAGEGKPYADSQDIHLLSAGQALLCKALGGLCTPVWGPFLHSELR